MPLLRAFEARFGLLAALLFVGCGEGGTADEGVPLDGSATGSSSAAPTGQPAPPLTAAGTGVQPVAPTPAGPPATPPLPVSPSPMVDAPGAGGSSGLGGVPVPPVPDPMPGSGGTPASASGGGAGPAPGAAGSSETGCAADQMDCAGVCASTLTDAMNCGACGTMCPVGASCVAGDCSCLGTTSECDGQCVDTQTDGQHCGACGNACEANEVCAMAACSGACPDTTTQCEQSCVNLQSDAANCGECGTSCEPGEQCVFGSCQCSSGLVACDATCADTDSDANHCGECDTACAAGQSCTNGVCECAGEEELCEGQCVDTETDADFCGSCDTACAAGQTCTDGVCECPDGATSCGGQCVDTATSEQYCGNCSTTCDPAEQCTNGACQSPVTNSDYPCDGSTAGYDQVVTLTGGDARAPVQAALGNLSSGRTSKQSVLVQGNGTIAANARINVPSYTILNFCGTINVTGSPSGDNAVIYGRGVRDIEIPNITITGTPAYGVFFRESQNLHFGQVDIRISNGLGFRVDSGPNYANRSSNVSIDYVYVEGAPDQGVETYGVDGLTIGTVIARDVGYSGLLLNQSTDVEVGLVDGDNVAAGQGYAVFRMANNNGEINGSHPMNVHVGQVIARGGGRGIFCVTESGGATIDHVDIEGTGNNSILIESCFNITIGNASTQSRIANSGELRTAKRSDLPAPADILFQNIAVTGTSVREDPCVDSVNWTNVTENGSLITSNCP